MTFEEAVGRIFDFKGKKFYVVRPINTTFMNGLWQSMYSRPVVVDLETSTQIIIYSGLVDLIPPEWKEILPL